MLNGTWYCTQAVGKEWIAAGHPGAIVNIVTTYAWTAGPGVIHSACAKAGVLAMTRTLAVEWGSKYGIRVNAVAPGPIADTGGAERLLPDEEAVRKTVESVPLGRLGRPRRWPTPSCFSCRLRRPTSTARASPSTAGNGSTGPRFERRTLWGTGVGDDVPVRRKRAFPDAGRSRRRAGAFFA